MNLRSNTRCTPTGAVSRACARPRVSASVRQTHMVLHETMTYGQLTGNTSINETIYRCFEHISEDDARLFVRKFRDQLADNDQVMHTFRELLVGGFLGANGLNVANDRTLGGKTPDWSILASDGHLSGVVELVNFHTSKAIEDEINECRAVGRVWVGRIGPHAARLSDRIREKAAKYKRSVEQAKVPYVVSVFSEFTAGLDLEEVQRCLFDEENGLFRLYPSVSGLLFFEERTGRYLFTYIASPCAAMEMLLPSGEF